jgi:hypothetical protein
MTYNLAAQVQYELFTGYRTIRRSKQAFRKYWRSIAVQIHREARQQHQQEKGMMVGSRTSAYPIGAPSALSLGSNSLTNYAAPPTPSHRPTSDTCA